MRIRAVAVAGVVAVGLVAVGPVAAAAPGGDPTSDAVNAVVAFDPGNESTFAPLEDVIDAGGVQLQALRPHLGAAALDRRWAATYVAHNLARSESDYRILAPRLRDRDPSVRALAAFALLTGGRTEAIPVLIDLLGSPLYLLNSEPLVPIAGLAGWRLERLTRAGIGFDPDAGAADRRRALERWRAWWQRVRDRIRWDAAAGRFRWPGATASRTLSMLPMRAAQPGGTVPSGPVFGTGATLDGETLTISVQVELVFPAGLSGKARRAVKRAANRAEGFLDGRGRSGMCVEVEFEVDVRTRDVGDPITEGYHQLQIVVGSEGEELASGRFRRSHIDGPRPVPGVEIGTGELTTGGIEQYGERLVAHELAHLLDLGDEYTRNAQGKYAYPHDPDSFLADGASGAVLQRHLDFLVERLLDEAALGCELWQLEVAPWTTRLTAYTSGSTDYIGRVAKASISAQFWANPRTGEIWPAGDAPCGSRNLTSPCAGLGGPQKLRGGNSQLSGLQILPGAAKCSQLSYTAVRERFTTTVTGRRREGELRLELDVPDQEVVRYVCERTGPYRPNKTDVRDGMGAAGALDFTIALEGEAQRSGSRAFLFDERIGRASGTIRVTRLV